MATVIIPVSSGTVVKGLTRVSNGKYYYPSPLNPNAPVDPCTLDSVYTEFKWDENMELVLDSTDVIKDSTGADYFGGRPRRA